MQNLHRKRLKDVCLEKMDRENWGKNEQAVARSGLGNWRDKSIHPALPASPPATYSIHRTQTRQARRKIMISNMPEACLALQSQYF